MNTLTSLTPRIPGKVWLNGNLYVPQGIASLLLPGFGDRYRLVVYPGEAVVGHVWYDHEFSGNEPTHFILFNRMPWGSAPLKMRSNVDGGDETYMLDPLCAFGWTNQVWLASRAEMRPVPEYRAAIEADTADVGMTTHTGSAGINFYAHATTPERWGYDALLYLDANLRKNLRRPRWLVSQAGTCAALDPTFQPADYFGDLWDAAKKRLRFNYEWAVNAYGLNALDGQHLDADEAQAAFGKTRHPLYLAALLQTYYVARTFVGRLHDRDKEGRLHYGGVPRTPGHFLTVCGDVIAALEGLDGEPWDSIRETARLDAMTHASACHDLYERGAFATIEGSVPPDWHVDGTLSTPPLAHRKPFMDARLAWGAQRCSDPRLATRILDWLEAECFDGARVASLVSAEGAKKEWGALNGTAYWLLPPLIRGGRQDGALAQALLASLKLQKSRAVQLSFAAPLLGVTP